MIYLINIIFSNFDLAIVNELRLFLRKVFFTVGISLFMPFSHKALRFFNHPPLINILRIIHPLFGVQSEV